METPPINLFSNKVDPEGVLQLVLAEHPDAEVEKDPEAGHWTSITIRRKRGLLKKSESLVINHDPEYYGGEGWSGQRDGMAGYFQKFPMEDLQRARLLATVGAFGFALSCVSRPPVFPDEDDFRNDLIGKIATRLEACIFIPGALLDSEYRTLVSVDGENDPDAQFPDHAQKIKAEVQVRTPDEADGLDDDEGLQELNPPSPERVAARAMVLACVATRGLMEIEAADLAEEERAKVVAAWKSSIDWLGEIGVEGELEPAEREVIHTPVGQLSMQQNLDSVWRFEGLVVLAWALGLHDMPRYDVVTGTGSLLDALGIVPDDLEKAKAILATPRLRPPDHIEALGEQIFAFHWRMRDFSVRPVAMDFQEFGKNCWFGPLDLSWANLVDDDLALGGKAIATADEDVITSSNSIAQERHQAINWLRGQCEIYSETDTPT